MTWLKRIAWYLVSGFLLILLASFLRDQFGDEDWFGKYTHHWLFDTYCEPYVACHHFVVALGLFAFALSMTFASRATKSAFVRVLDIIAAIIAGLSAVGFLASSIWAML